MIQFQYIILEEKISNILRIERDVRKWGGDIVERGAGL